jgi:hypothetical protein
VGGDLIESLAAFEVAYAELAKRVQDEAWQLAETDVVDVTRRLHALNSRAQGLGVRMIRELDTRSIPTTMGATSLRAFVSGILRLSPQAAGQQARLSKTLHENCAATGNALSAGAVNFEQATAITRVLTQLPAKATPDQRDWAEEFLLDHAKVLNAEDLAMLSKRIDAAIDPDGTLPREKTAAERRSANLRNNHDGTQTLTWRDTDEVIAELKAAMIALAAPRPAEDGTRDNGTPEIRRADAMREIVSQAVRHGAMPAARGERPRLVITATADTLRTGAGFGRTNSGDELSGEAVRRIGCDADLFALIMTKHGAPLKLGRRRRSVSPTQWVAICARDIGCVFPGCTRPPEFCDAHHLKHWGDFGFTDDDNLALLCGHHHELIHHSPWEIYLGEDRMPWLRPPPWIDPERTPIRNTYWDTQPAVRDRLDPADS